VPFAIRGMLRILVIKAQKALGRGKPGENVEFFASYVAVTDDDIFMLSEILIGCWLNTGFRNPSCFGVLPIVDREQGFQFKIFQAARMVFEHTLMLQKIPTGQEILGFDLKRINVFIEENKDLVYMYYNRILNVDITHIEVPPVDKIGKYEARRQMIETTLVRVDDVKMFVEMSHQIYEKKILSEDTILYSIMKEIVHKEIKRERGKKILLPSIYDRVTSPYFHIVSYLKREQMKLA